MNNLIHTLKTKKLTLATAESCTAGYVSYLITKTPGASKVFKGGLIVYSLESKTKFFGIPPTSLNKNQGVSKEVALTLAKKVKSLFRAEFGASVVGFAGPGTKAGTVYIAVSTPKNDVSKKLILKGNRDQVRKGASHRLLRMLMEQIS